MPLSRGVHHRRVLAEGIGIGTGRARGRAVVLLPRGQPPEFKAGDILVVPSLMFSEWVEYFKMAAAVVTDHGGRTSHAALLATESMIPCVVGTEHATRHIKTGDRVVVDADQGLVLEAD